MAIISSNKGPDLGAFVVSEQCTISGTVTSPYFVADYCTDFRADLDAECIANRFAVVGTVPVSNVAADARTIDCANNSAFEQSFVSANHQSQSASNCNANSSSLG